MKVVEFLWTTIPALVTLYANFYAEKDLAQTKKELGDEFNIPKTKTYDFIIVGGGTAGCVLAGRLSEKFNVLLLEAGGDPPPAVAVPYFAAQVTLDETINYLFHTHQKDDATRNIGGNLTIHTGKMLGGSGSHNDLVHSRGSPFDYDNWATLTNDSTWNYESVLQYFKKSETYTGKRFGPQNHSVYYGTDGPIQVQLNDVPILDLWFDAGRQLGFDINDPNGFQTKSFAPLNKAVGNGRRSSAYSQYVQPNEGQRQSLTVIRYANVSEILIDEAKKAYGVAYSRHNLFPQIAHASKEVILSAGAFSSPLLLMKSGIGPEKMLKDAGITVKVPIEAVGKNLAEHPAIILHGFAVNDSSLFLKMRSNEVEQIFDDFHKENGILTTAWEGPQCFMVSSKSEKSDWPDVWILAAPSVILDDAEPSISIGAIVGRPKSKGTLTLDTEAYKNGIRDDTQLAIIDFNFMSNTDDLEAMLEGIKFIFKITEETTAFKSLNTTYSFGPIDQCSEEEFRSDEYWKCFIREQILSWIHMVGTNSMGPTNLSSNNTVVDNELRVRGVTGLRVVDASVIPAVTNANLNAPIIMLAEKAADLIQKQWSTERNKATLCYSNTFTALAFIAISFFYNV